MDAPHNGSVTDNSTRLAEIAQDAKNGLDAIDTFFLLDEIKRLNDELSEVRRLYLPFDLDLLEDNERLTARVTELRGLADHNFKLYAYADEDSRTKRKQLEAIHVLVLRATKNGGSAAKVSVGDLVAILRPAMSADTTSVQIAADAVVDLVAQLVREALAKDSNHA